MFRRLRIKFIITTMVLLTSIVILICTLIYISTKKNSEYMIFSQIGDNLNNVKSIPNQGERGPITKDTTLVIYDKKTSTIAYSSDGDMDERVVISMVNNALDKGKEKGFISNDNYSLAYIYRTSPLGIEMVFKDNSLYEYTMKRLVVTFSIVGGISTIWLYIISVLIANKAIKPVEEAYNSQKRFIADASHELKTPLAVVKTNIELLNANKEDTIQNQKKWIDYISFQTDRMSKLVNNLLYLAKADNNEELGIKTDLNISDVVMNQLLSFEAVLYENNLKLKCDVEENIKFNGNKEDISQLVGIFMDNAIKHSDKNSEIYAVLSEQKHKISLSVTNKGETILIEDIDKIFERFYRVDKSRTREKGGYGLGLSIAKSIVDKCTGKIKVRSENNLTTFSVEITSISEKL